MADGEDQGGFPVVVVKGDIAAVAEVDGPFAVFRFHVFGGPANLRMAGEDLGLAGAFEQKLTVSKSIFAS